MRLNVRLYKNEDPLGSPGFNAMLKLLEEIDATRAMDRRVPR
jgi:hypothetical protein